MKGYKGFDKDMKCRDFQYEVGKTYKTEKAVLCNDGFHFCEWPLDCFGYYAPADGLYAEIEAGGTITDKEAGGDTKRACTEITIVRILSKKEIAEICLGLAKEKENNTGDQSSASNTGDRSSASNTGDQSSASNTGDQSSASNTGNLSSASNTGNLSSASNTGYRSSASNTGKEGYASAVGIEGKAKGAKGNWITCAEWRMREREWHRVNVKTTKIDGKKIKADTWYCLKGGKFKEVKE